MVGSVIMDPEDVATIAQNLGHKTGNITIICATYGQIESYGIYKGTNPLHYWVPLLLIQMSLSCATFLFLTAILKPFCLPMVVRQLLAGIILGPSVLCKNRAFANAFFPLRGLIMMDTVAAFGFILYFFLIGVQMDPYLFKNVDRKTMTIGLCSVGVPMVISTTACAIIVSHISLDVTLAKSLPYIAQAESLLSLPIIAGLLAELKIINSEFGRVALSASFMAGIFCTITVIATVLWQPDSPAKSTHSEGVHGLVNILFLLLIIIFIMRPLLLCMIRQSPEGQPLKESYVVAIIMSALFTGFLSRALGLNLYLGPFAFGICMPAGPPVGSSIVERLDLITNWLFMPLYLVKNGLVINISTIELKNYLVIQSVAIISAFGKFLGTYVVSRLSDIPSADAAALGLVMNAQGVLELGVFKLMKREQVISNEAYVIMCISLMIVNGTIAPVIKFLYDPSKKFTVYKRRSLMNLKSNLELRVLVCIHEDINVPAMINVLEALNPTKRSPLMVYVLHFIELVGRSNALLIPHKRGKTISNPAKTSEQIFNVFRSFESNNSGLVSVLPYTSISPINAMHNDVCSMALDQRTSLILVPFHERMQPNGTSSSVSYKRAIKITNLNILDKAPCSIAMLVENGFIGRAAASSSQACFRVAVLFLGGTDDREALAIGARMAGHQCIKLTLVRLLENGSISSDETEERKIDNIVVSEFRIAMRGNLRVMYIEEVVMDGLGTILVTKSMQDQYDLIIVGKRHDPGSLLLSKLTDWQDQKDLGIVADLFSAAQFINSTIMVVQQANTMPTLAP
ncbi:cation/H(+) antiporter 15-like [Euphorbia lathyris]|uniref:cation/H(+) antiporter 15-like n=1 Tax=Euphorbia lathyris TaxID=212925 RepID=UPI003313D564